MKDLEKIKSEDLAAQVQDANPGNFAIEQEVAQLVGATVPAPTEPSADDARELGAQLLVFLRRALLPIRTALRTAVAAIYAHLDSRCTDYTPAAYDPFRLPAGPYDPMRPFVPRTLPNLLTALTAFSDRKISGVPEAADGISLVHLLFDNSNITEFSDTNKWESVGKSFPRSVFPNVNKLHIGVTKIMQTLNPGGTFSIFFDGTIDDLQADDLEFVGVHTDSAYGYSYYCQVIARQINNEILSLPGLKRIYNTSSDGSSDAYGRPILGTLPNCKKLYVENLTDIRTSCSGWSGKGTGTQCLANAPELLELYTGISGDTNANNTSASYKFVIAPKLQKFVIGGVLTTRQDKGLFNTTSADLVEIRIGGAECSLDMRDWNPTNVLADADKTATFLQNFREHIALRLTANGSGLTLTLSQAVRNAIHAAESTYGIENIIVTQKGWRIQPDAS